MNNKIVIITGANSGIGKAASLIFARAGCTLIMACRNIERSKAVRDEIISHSNNKNVFLREADMSSFASIRTFSSEFKNEFPKLDTLINNAAYFNHGEEYRLSADNIEIAFATNVLGPFLLTNLLLDHLKRSDDARILNASSNIIKHFFSPKKEIDLNNLQGITGSRHKHSVYARYRNSKMAFLMMSFRMAEEYKDKGIKINSLLINGARMSKETLNKFKPGWRVLAMLQNLIFPPPELMADLYYKICTSEEYKTTSGKLFNHKQQIMLPGPDNAKPKHILGSSHYPLYANRQDVTQSIWDVCMRLTEGQG
jgi:NAD(P)-dependent dehydrogenase (short-subunit alcohol dehydrogenase family)